jgi:chromosome segregation ATPase
MNKEERLEYLEDERKKIWLRLSSLEDQLKKKTSDYEAEAKVASEQAEIYKKASEDSNKIIASNLEEVQNKLSKVKTDFVEFEKLFNDIKQNSESASANNELIGTIHKSLEAQSESVKSQIAEIQKIFDSKPVLDERLSKLEEVFKKGDDYDSKLNTLYKSINDRKKEIDELYYEIIGYSETDESGQETEVKGLKDELEESYNELTKKMKDSEDVLNKLVNETKNWYTAFTTEKKDEFTNLTTKWTAEYSGVLAKIETLLPNALTTGLSYAYSEKKKAEEDENKSHRTSFNYAIGGLVAISLIPFAISIVSLFQGTELVEVIMRVPRIVLAILPLYLPVLWVAYSANRKMNLAKRLIEEYSHKEVLSKTFEGLSKQIDSIDDKDTSADLRIKLLYNILEVNSENPGKLISDYNKSDHPLMDALDKSIKLTNAVTRLSKIPGFTKLASTLAKKSEDILKDETKKAEAGLEALTEGQKTKN